MRRRCAEYLGTRQGTSGRGEDDMREHAGAERGIGDLLFPDGVSWEFLGRGLKEQHHVVPQNAHEDLRAGVWVRSGCAGEGGQGTP